MNPVKAKYGVYDGARAQKYFGKENIKMPSFFPILSLLVRLYSLTYLFLLSSFFIFSFSCVFILPVHPRSALTPTAD